MNEPLLVTALWGSHAPRVDVSSAHSDQSDYCVPIVWVAMCVVDATDSSREHSAPDGQSQVALGYPHGRALESPADVIDCRRGLRSH
jgi:hypothetical protein